jgi:branched-chain amino acid transport system substrate-binding protein
MTKPTLCAALLAFVLISPASAQKNYGPGVTDTEIKIGQTMPYSGPASLYSTIGKAEAAYFAKINAEGGINGRKINFISRDDGYNPSKTVEQTRRLVEQDGVLLIFGTLGTAVNTAIHRYLNERHIPQLLIASIGMKWNDPQNFPWTIAFQPDQTTEISVYVRYILAEHPDAKIAVLNQNDDFGGGYLKPLEEALGNKAKSMLVAQASHEVTDPTIDSQIVALRSSGADTLLILTSPKFAAMALRKTYDIGWKPLEIVSLASATVASVMKPAGLEKTVGVISGAFAKDPTDPSWQNEAETQEWSAWMKQWYPDGDRNDAYNVGGYVMARALVDVLQRCGDNLTRENVMNTATQTTGLHIPMTLPGITVNLSPNDYRVMKQLQLERFDGEKWTLFGGVIEASAR